MSDANSVLAPSIHVTKDLTEGRSLKGFVILSLGSFECGYREYLPN